MRKRGREGTKKRKMRSVHTGLQRGAGETKRERSDERVKERERKRNRVGEEARARGGEREREWKKKRGCSGVACGYTSPRAPPPIRSRSVGRV